MKTTRNKINLILLLLIALVVVPRSSFAVQPNFTFALSLDSITLDPDFDSQVCPGLTDWYVWKYRIDVVAPSAGQPSLRNALSNWVLELPNCYITSPLLFQEIEASAGWGGGDQVRVYSPSSTINDPNSGLSGLKWEFVSGDQLDTIGEYDFFWFSAPTDVAVNVDWAIKSGGTVTNGTVEGPDCPECGVIPEPTTMLLWGAGLVGAALLRRKRR